MVEVGRVTAAIDGDISGLQSKLSLAKSEATSAVAGIEASVNSKMGAGLTGALSGGYWRDVGKNLGTDVVSGIAEPFGALGNVASSIATTLGPAGISAVAGVADAAAISAAVSSVAMEWEAGLGQVSKEVSAGFVVNVAQAIESEVESAGDLINSSIEANWFDPESLQAAASRLEDLKIYDPEEFTEQGENNAIAYLNAVNDKIRSIELAELELRMDSDNERAREDLEGLISDLDQFAQNSPFKVPVSADFSLFKTAMDNVYIQKVQEIKARLSVDTTKATTSIEEIESSIEEERKMPLKIDDAPAKATIAGIDAAASKPVTKIVYVREVSSGGGGGGGGGSTFFPSYAPPNTLDVGIFGSGWDSFPSYGIGDVFVPTPTLAVVGDRPGGEWIGGIDQAVARFGGAAGKAEKIVINYNPTIYSNMGKEELLEMLEEHDEKLMDMIGEKLNSSQFW